MGLPVQDTNHVAEGLALLTSRYASAPVVNGLLTSLLSRLQQLEDDCFDIIQKIQLSNHPLPGGPWDMLDKIGAIVGATRGGLDDADYLALIKITAFVNRARGLSEDVLQLALMMTNGATPLYIDCPPASFYLGCWNLGLNFGQFVSMLKQVRPAGVYGHFHYTTWPTGSDLALGSRYGGARTQGKLGSRYGGVADGGKLAAGVAL